MDQQDDMPRPPPAAWIEALERGEADLAAGRTVSAATVLAELQASNERMMHRRLAKKAPDAA